MFDLVIFCLGQENVSIPDNNIFIETEQRYCDIWKFISEQKGVWYNLYTNEDEIGGTNLCINLGFDSMSTLPEVPNADSKIIDCLTPYQINEKYIEIVKRTVEYYVEQSPLKLVYLLARYQCEEKEIVRGTYSVEKFFSLMNEGEIYANICYIISGKENALQ